MIRSCLMLSGVLLVAEIVDGGQHHSHLSDFWNLRTDLFKDKGPQTGAHRQGSTDKGAQTVHQWSSLEFEWPCDWVRGYYTEKGWFNPAANVLSGVDVYKSDVYVTVLRTSQGVPSGLNKVVVKQGRSLLQPFPSLQYNEAGNCSNLQFPIKSATDPNTGLMYVIDVGRTSIVPQPTDVICPPKLVILDLKKKGALVRSYIFPASVVPAATNMLNELALDYVSKSAPDVRYVYISDMLNEQIIVLDLAQNASWAFKHASMKPDTDTTIRINGINYQAGFGINGIALDPSYRFLYYSPVGSKKLHQIPTSVLREPSGDFTGRYRLAGTKASNSDGLVFGQKALYYGALSLNAVYMWNLTQDLQKVSEDMVTIATETLVAKDDVRFIWVESLTLDPSGHLWFTTSRMNEFLAGTLDVSGAKGSNFRINRVYVGDKPYLWKG
ncbi:major royal jelly protein 1-like [Physella acuta]|uniref:major royal jelly protein 1-like n=1 Tax=Physella acuta TaxID=109671 RepID=UPI0027DB5855|nr:major royal jelly protein 1-like [Physella acuta]XP_059151516.1 major royal jelly protein 1-like [Physella acuta]XP_059151518.1 major royal jelly protein 1-like [Physella acuta]XP_059151519.1 major royal jelly protein 1-like [Physella acuta]